MQDCAGKLALKRRLASEGLAGQARTLNLLACAVIALVGLLAYSNSYAAPFVFDGTALVRDNPLLRSLWPPWALLSGSNRPVVLLSFAVNYAIGGTSVWGFHVVNLAIHIAAGVVLFGIVRRTLCQGDLATRYGRAAWGLALATALLWTVHPLQTQSVTYLYQRFESLMGLLYLLTLYCFIRAQASRRAGWWYVASALCCVLAVGSKEVAVTAPLVVLWYDRAFLASSWREVWQVHRWYYLGFAAAFGLVALIMITHWACYPGGGVLVVEGVSPWEYARSQPGVVLHYLRLCFWPQGQCLDYGWPIARTAIEIVPPLAVLGVMLAATVWCVFRRPALGFLGGAFFLILAPTSSVAPIVDLAYEHRMYLSLGAVAMLAVLGAYELSERWAASRGWTLARRRTVQLGALAATVLMLACATYARNEAYAREATLWADVVRKAPHHARGHYNLACSLEAEGELGEAKRHYERAIELAPDDATSHNNLANLLAEAEPEAAIAHYLRAIEANPRFAAAHDNLAGTLARLGRAAEAEQHCREALAIDRNYAPAHIHLGSLLTERDPKAALCHLETAIRLQPESAEAHNNLANLLTASQPRAAIGHYQTALQLQPDYADAHYNLANLLIAQNRLSPAVAHLREALRIRPGWELATQNLKILLEASRRSPKP